MADRGNMMDSNSVQERFAQVVARTPDAIAVSSPAEALTYAELDERANRIARSEEHTSELQSLRHLVCRLLLEKKKKRCTNIYGSPGHIKLRYVIDWSMRA